MVQKEEGGIDLVIVVVVLLRRTCREMALEWGLALEAGFCLHCRKGKASKGVCVSFLYLAHHRTYDS